MKIICQNLNLHHLVTHAKGKEARVDKFASVLSAQQADVVVLQEVFVLNTLFSQVGSDLRTQLLQTARSAGLEYAALSKPANPVFGQDAGLLVLSRFPIAREYSVTFREYGWKEVTNKKGFLHVVLNLPEPQGCQLHIITLHMDAHEKLVRDNQVKQLRQHISGHVSTNDHLIVAGGFNVPSGTMEYRGLRNQLHPCRDGWADSSRSGVTHLDYIFWAPNVKFDRQTQEDFDVSDHPGIVASFHLVLEDSERLDAPKS